VARLAEIQALTWESVDLSADYSVFAQGWDEVEGRIAPKSDSAVGDVPIIGGRATTW